MILNSFLSSVTAVSLAVRGRRLPTQLEFERLLEAMEHQLSLYADTEAIPKDVVRGLLDLVSMMLMHAPDNEDESRLIEMYVEIDELAMRLIP